MNISIISLITFAFQGAISFLGTYPTEYNDFVSSVIVLPENDYILFGSTDSPFSQGSRMMWTNMFGDCVQDSISPPANINGCLSMDSCLVTVSTQQNALCLQKTTLDGTPCWTVAFPEYSEHLPREIISCNDGGYVILSQLENARTTSSQILKTDAFGEFQWLTSHDDSSPIRISQGAYGNFITCDIHGTGGRIFTLSSSGQLQNQFDFPDHIFRDVIFWNGVIAAAAVEDGFICIDNSGSILWSYAHFSSVEIYSIIETSDGNLAGTGSIMEGSQRRTYLAKTDQNGGLLWNNTFGFGDSFRSIFMTACPDNGFCSIGGYISDGSMNSFFIKTDSLGTIEPQGIESEYSTMGQNRILRIANPSYGNTVSLFVQQTAGTGITLIVTNIYGRIEETISVLPEESFENRIDITGLETGLYFVTAITSNAHNTLKLTVMN